MDEIEGSLRDNIATGLNRISGQLEGLRMSFLSLQETSTISFDDAVIATLGKQEIPLRQCLKVFTSAAEAVALETKSAISNMKSDESARQLAIITGIRKGLVGNLHASGQSQQMFLDTAEGEAAKATMTSFFD